MIAGFVFGGLGLLGALVLHPEVKTSKGELVFFALGFLFFGWGLVMWLTYPFFRKPRLVPYFAREVQPYSRETAAAFWRGRALYREIATLDELAAKEGVPPLSAFGFADDYYEQEVQWYPASEGLRTVGAIKPLVAAPDLTGDLGALESALKAAAELGVDFSIALRVHNDSLQAVSSMQQRQGRFW